jgi:heme-degrading monooxygenase HmoA
LCINFRSETSVIYEFKTYRAAPGAIGALIKRFKQTTMPIFSRLGIEVVHCWTSAAEPDAFFYMVRFDSEQAGKAAWAAFGSDAEWKAAKAASETNGPLLASQTTVYLQPTDFSPLSS